MQSTPYCYVCSHDKTMELTIYTVGFFIGDDWQALYDVTSIERALALISYLNGGNMPSWLA